MCLLEQYILRHSSDCDEYINMDMILNNFENDMLPNKQLNRRGHGMSLLDIKASRYNENYLGLNN